MLKELIRIFLPIKKGPKNFKNTGDFGEYTAERYLRDKNYKILERNWKNNKGRRMGEIDIIAKEKDYIVFVEVKTRVGSRDTIVPEEAIDDQKFHKLQSIAWYYLKTKATLETPHRYDSIAVWINNETGHADIRHTEFIY